MKKKLLWNQKLESISEFIKIKNEEKMQKHGQA